jgi:hypothetical protein
VPRENYARIVKGYQPKEPAGFFEKVFYLLWLPVCIFQIMLVRVRLNRTKCKQPNNEKRRRNAARIG